eukprot:TRINITY_DN1713_c0_g1_i1.p1 TRINITY_DN1713_c0_g1~~TRINITY_DN1713_c0_g1_i1.p1  ORF type:complete len:114 (+),score=21.37 TRINITY_DN1713_c0_g1_i1:190-531(+)
MKKVEKKRKLQFVKQIQFTQNPSILVKPKAVTANNKASDSSSSTYNPFAPKEKSDFKLDFFGSSDFGSGDGQSWTFGGDSNLLNRFANEDESNSSENNRFSFNLSPGAPFIFL